MVMEEDCMQKLNFTEKLGKLTLYALIALALVGASILAPLSMNSVAAASAAIPVNMIYYGWHDTTVNNSIINAHPQYLVDNSPAGPWKGNASIGSFTSAGIKYFEYIDGGYEGTAAQAIPNDLQSNLNYIDAAAEAGAYGVFLDEVSNQPNSASINYLSQIYAKAHSLGLKVAFNTGVDSWSDTLMNYCDYMNSSEVWNNGALTASQSKWASRTWLLSQNITSATTAANLTNAAINKGVNAHYACTSYGALPSWLGTYVAQISISNPTPTSTPTTPTGQSTVTFGSNPVGSEIWLDYTYQGATPLSLTISTGNHHIGFNKYGYHNNTPIEGDFLLGNAAMTINGDLVSGQITYSGTASPTPIPVLTAPTVSTMKATGITSNGATLNGNLSSKDSASSISVSFEWGTTTAYGNTTAVSPMTTTGAFNTTISGLASNTTYHFRAKAASSATAVGSDITFKTLTPTPSITPASGNTVGTVVGKPVASGGANEYNFYLKITSTTVSGVTVGQQLWCAASKTTFPNLLTRGVTLRGNLDHSLGWWVIK
jgi:hypothetical protein